MKNEWLFIRQKVGRRIQAIRVNTESDIPEFLQKTITVDEDGKVNVICNRDNIAIRKLPIVVMYVKTPNPRCPSGYSAWPVHEPENTLVELKGNFYERPTEVFKVKMIGQTMPPFLDDQRAFIIDDTWYLHILDGSLQYAKIGCGCWRLSLSGDVEIIANDVYDEYVVCNEDGTVDIAPLNEYLQS